MENNQSCIRVFADKVQIDNCREILQTNDKAFSQLSGLLALAGNEVRLKNLISLRRRKRTLSLRPFRHSRNEHPCRFATPQKTKRRKRH